MFENEVQVRVRYAETDQMGVVYYGNYATYLEVARVETFRELGLSYKGMEDMGVMMPVIEYKTKYIKPAKYDDLLTIKVKIVKEPSVKIEFHYEIYNEAGVLLNIAETTLVFLSSSTGKITNPPQHLSQELEKYFNRVEQ
jgi:acyl-CoA thioester hydrolase